MSENQESLHFLDYWRVIRSRKEIVLAVSLLVVLTGILITYSMPKVYCATSVIKVKEEASDLNGSLWANETMGRDPLFLRTQFEIIQSATVLEEVVRKRDLAAKLSKAYGYDRYSQEKIFDRTVKLLSKSMKVQQYRDTNLIEINIYLSEPKGSAPMEAADAANAVADVYRDQQAKRSRETVEKAMKALNESVVEQKARVVEAEKAVEAIRQKYKIDMMTPSYGVDSSVTMTKMALAKLDSQRIELKSELTAAEVKFQTVSGLTASNLLASAPFLVGDKNLEKLVQEKEQLEVELRAALQRLGEKHPDVDGLKQRIDEKTKQIDNKLVGMRIGVEYQFNEAKAKYSVLTNELERLTALERDKESSHYREFESATKEFEHARHIYEVLETRMRQEDIEQKIPRTIVERIKTARPPDEDDPVSPILLLNVVLSIVVGLCSGVGLAYLIEYLDVSVKTIEDIERSMGVPVLGVIPQRVKPLADKSVDATQAEPYRVLRANVKFSNKFTGGKTFCVTSGSVGEGKSLTLFNLAYVCAELGDKILIVDADMHRPRQHKMLGLPNKTGLANVLVGDVTLDEAIISTNLPTLDLLPSGRLSIPVHGLLDTRKTKELVRELSEKYDMVFFDTPPIIGVSDASLIVREMDGVVLVIQHRKYPRWVSHRAKKMLDTLGANIIGVVLNNINISRDYSYYYYYHQQYYGAYPAKKAGGNE